MVLRDDGTKRFLLHKTRRMIMSFTETENNRDLLLQLWLLFCKRDVSQFFYMLVLDVFKLSK